MNDYVLAVERMQEYIDNNICDEITLADLSKVSNFSPWYSIRLFKEYVGLTPAEYIRKLRLSKSALLLRDTKTKIIDVAFSLGFKSVDGYTRAFYKEFHCTPKNYSKHPIPLKLYVSYKIKYKYLKEVKKMSHSNNIFIKEIEKPERKVLIKRGIKATEYFEYCYEVGCDIWGILTSMKSLSNEPVCMWLPDAYVLENTSKYVQGVEVPLDYNGEIPEGFDVVELPKSTYLMFIGEAFKEEDFALAITTLQNAMENVNLKALGYKLDTSNPKIQLEPIGERGYIELLPVIKIN